MASGVHQPFVPVGQVCRFKISGQWQSSPWNALFAFQYAVNPPDAASLTALADQISTAWNSAWGTFYDTSYTWNSVTVWDIASATGSSGVSGTSHTATGSNVGLPTVAVAVAVSWHVQIRYRGGHFRTYMPCRSMSAVSAGKTLQAAEATAYANAAGAFRTAINGMQLGGSNIVLGGVHYTPPRVEPKTNGSFYAFSAPTVRHRVDSQRRRLGKELT